MDFRKLHDARVQAHHAVQWLARAARCYIPERSYDSHTNLGWDDTLGGFTTHPLPNGSHLGLRIADLTLCIAGPGSAELPLDGRANVEIRRWLGDRFSAMGLDPAALDAPPPYEMPWHVVEIGARYSLEELGEPLAVLATWYANANALLGQVQRGLKARKLMAPPVRCWPHHFDLDCAVPFGGDRGMGVGFSPGDEYCDEPYFYVSMYPEPSIPGLPLLPALGHWHTYHFLAALAPAHKIVAAVDQGVYARDFLDVAVKAALTAMR
jgi:hypothetical protein